MNQKNPLAKYREATKRDPFEYLDSTQAESDTRLRKDRENTFRAKLGLIERIVRWSLLVPALLFCVFMWGFQSTDNEAIKLIKLITASTLVVQVAIWYLVIQAMVFLNASDNRWSFENVIEALFTGTLLLSMTALMTCLALLGDYYDYSFYQKWELFSIYGLLFAGLLYLILKSYKKIVK